MKFLIMDHTGHSEELFDVADKVSLKDAMARFQELMEKGNIAAVPRGDGQHNVTRTFDPTAEQVLFARQLVGG